MNYTDCGIGREGYVHLGEPVRLGSFDVGDIKVTPGHPYIKIKDEVMKEETDFNLIVRKQLESLINAQGISTEIKMQDGEYQISILIERMEDE